MNETKPIKDNYIITIKNNGNASNPRYIVQLVTDPYHNPMTINITDKNWDYKLDAKAWVLNEFGVPEHLIKWQAGAGDSIADLILLSSDQKTYGVGKPD